MVQVPKAPKETKERMVSLAQTVRTASHQSLEAMETGILVIQTLESRAVERWVRKAQRETLAP